MTWTALTVEWTRAAEKDLRGLPTKLREQIREAVTVYAATGAGDMAKMQNGSGYRLRVRNQRAFCDIQWSALRLTVLGVDKRGDAY